MYFINEASMQEEIITKQTFYKRKQTTISKLNQADLLARKLYLI